MKKKVLETLLAAAFCLTVITGCAGNETSVEDAPEQNEVQETESTEDAEETTENDAEAETVASDYEPVTITVDLERSGLGDKVEETFTEPPTHVVAKGDQMADYFFDLGLENNMAGYTHGSCYSTVSQYDARETVPLLGDETGTFTKEELLAVEADFLVGWDSTFSEKNFDKNFCQENGIAMYTPYCTSDSATFEDIYKDYETLGKIFNVKEVAAQKVEAMKEKIAAVKETLGEDAYNNPVSVFVFDSGEDAPFTACQGMPGDIIKLAGGISTFDDIDAGWATVSWEQVVERNPEVILVLDYNGDTQEKIDFLYSNEALANVDAVKNKRIISACCSDMQGSAGSAGTVEILAKALYPEKFQ